MLSVRLAELADQLVLFQWVNDQAVRNSAARTKEIEWSEHVAWFRSVLSDSLVTQLIGEVDGRPIGQVRFDKFERGLLEIDISVSADLRGEKLGVILLEAACGWMSARNGPFRAVAHIKPNNKASIATFESAGYRLIGPDDSGEVALLRYERSYE